MKKVLSVFLGMLILLSTLSPLSVLAGAAEQYDEECVSDWVLESEAPEGAYIVDTKWDYTLTRYTESNSSTMSGWTCYSSKITSYGVEQGPLDYDPSKYNSNYKVRSEKYTASSTHYYRYYHYANANYNSFSYEESTTYSKGPYYFDFTSPLTTKGNSYSGHQSYKYYHNDKGNYYLVWFLKEWDDVKKATRWYYQEPVYTYYFTKTEQKTSSTEIKPEDATGTDVISNVQKKVRYLLELDVFDEATDTHIAKNGVIYSLNKTDKTATVISYQNLDESITSVEITIPSKVVVDTEFYAVTSIANNAFEDCSILTKINLPKSIISIGAEAFIYCAALTEIVIPSSVETIGESAFAFCSGMKKAVIGNGVKTVGASAFRRCSTLEKVSLGKSVESVGEQAFAYCGSLRWVYFIGEKPEVATDVFKRSIASTTNKTITIYYNSAKSSWYGIGGWKDDVGFVTKLYLTQTLGYTNEADWINYIDWYVYNQGDIIYLDEDGYDFQGNQYSCANGTATLVLYDEAENITGGDICIPSKVFFNTAEYNVNAIGANLFKNCKTLTRISIGDNISTIGANAFENCTNLISVTYGSGLTTISSAAFKNCTSLKELYFKGEAPTSVQGDSFSGVPSDAFVVRYNGKTTWSQKWNGFTVYNCDILTAVDNTTYFKDKTGVYYTVLSAEDKKAIVGKKISTTAEDPENASCTGYAGTEEITIADFVDINGEMYMVSGLDRFAFFNSKIPSIKLGRFIGYGMTDEQPGIWDCTFRQCSDLKSVTVSADNKVYYSANGVLYKYDKVLNSTPTLLMLYPRAKEGTSFTVPNGVTSINQYAFSGQENLQTINLNSVVTVGDHAFSDCIYLRTATMSSVRTVEKQAFYNCSSLSAVDLSQIDTIGDKAFFGCASLSTVSLNGITKIGTQAFVKCSNIKAFTVTNSSNYSSDGSGVLFEADGNNKKLLQYPAGRTATAYTLSDVTVNTIEPYAFYGAANLAELNLSDSLVTIGEHAFDNCTSIQKIYIGTSVKSIGTRAFYDCLALESFSVSQSNAYYWADKDGVLYKYARNEDGELNLGSNGSMFVDTLVCYPAALQRNAYTVEGGVTTINSAAFAQNTHLIRVILPSTLNYVRDEVFAGCTNLAEIYFKGEIPVDFGEGVVDSTSKDLIVYYLEGNTSWITGPLPKALNDCTIKAYNAIEELPNNISHVNSYAIVITNSEGKTVSNSTVKANGVSATYTNGMYVFGMPEGYDASKGITVSVVTPGYYTYENTLFLDEELHLSYITIKKQSTLQGVSCENVDINTKTHSINKWLYSESAGALRIGSELKIAVQGYCDTSYIISKYAIVQNGTVIATAVPGPSDANGLSKKYTLSIPAEKLIVGAKLQICMEVWDNAENKVVETLYSNLNISIYSKSIAIKRYNSGAGVSSGSSGGSGGSSGSTGSGSVATSGDAPMTPVSLDLGKGINVTLQDKRLPALAGLGFKLKWSNLSMDVKVKSSDELVVGLYPKDIDVKDGNQSYKLTLHGKITLKYSANRWVVSNCNIKCDASVKIAGGKQTVIYGIPIYISWSAKVGSGININLYYDAAATKLKMKSFYVSLTGNLFLSAGLGCSYANAGIYGTTNMFIGANVTPNVSLHKWTLDGAIGLYLKVKFPKIDYKYPIINGKCVLYQNGKWLPYNSQYYSAANMYLAENYALTTSSADTELKTDVKIVRLSSNKVAKIYMVNVNSADCEVASTYDAYNSDKLVYQVGTLNALTGSYKWSDPVVLDDNGLNDVSFDVYYDEEDGNSYIAYSQTSGKIGKDTTAESYVGMTEVKAAKWSGNKFEIMEASNTDGFVTDNGVYDNAPIMTVVSGIPVLVWSSNADNNFLGVSDYNYVDEETGEYYAYETNANTIWYSMFDGEVWTTPEKVVDKLPTVNSYSADNLGNLVFNVDPDSNPLTTDADGNYIDDTEFYQVELGDTYKFASLSEVEGCNAKSVNALGDTFVYTCDGVVYNYADNSVIADTGISAIEDTVVVKNTNDEISAILFTQGVAIDEETTGDAVFGMFYDGTEWGKPVQLTKAAANKNISSFDAGYVRNKLVIDMQYVSISENTENTEELVADYELNSVLYEFNDDVIVNAVELNQEDVVAGEAVAVLANITNNSGNKLTEVDVSVVAPDSETIVYSDTVDVTVKPGESANVEFSFIPSSVVSGEYSVYLTTDKEADETDNSGAIKLAYSDLEVYSKQIVLNEGYYLIAGVSNNGNTPASGTLYVAKDIKNDESTKNANEDYLYKISCDNIQPGYVKYYKIVLDEEFFDDGANTGLVTLYAENNNMDNESDTENNYEYISTVDVVEDIDENVSLPAEVTPYMVDDYFAYEISKGTEDVTFEYVSNGYTLTGIADVSSNDYTITDTSVTLTSEYIKSLGEGEHQFTAIFTNGDKQIARMFTVINFANYYNVTWKVGDEITDAGLVEVGTVPEFTGSTDKASDDKYDYKFAGWDTDADGIADYLPDEEFSAITGEIKFVAVYEAVEKTFSVIWDVDGRITEKQYKEGETPIYYGSTEKASTGTTYYVFRGWDTDDDGIADIASGEALPAVEGAQRYTAVYRKALPITEDDFTIDLAAEKYTGEAITKKITSSLVEGKDYKVTYMNNISAGEATIKIEAIGNYGGTLTYKFEIRNGVYIGSTRYATLSEAVDAVPEDSTETTITLYSDITSLSKINVLDGKNIVLDMNDCTFTSSIVSGYAIDVSGKLDIKGGILSVENAGGVRVQDGAVCEITGMNINAAKNAIYNMGTIAEISDNHISAETAIYNVSVIERIASGVYTGSKRGIYNDGSIQSLCGGSFKGDILENAIYSTDAGEIIRKAGSINYTDLETGYGYLTVVPQTEETFMCSEYCTKQLDDLFNDSSYIYKGTPSNITNYSNLSGYFGTGSVVSVFDAESGEYVKSVNVVLPGDVNGDSVCDVLDCAKAALVSNGFTEFTGACFDAANFDYNDEITTEDYSAIVNLALQ